MMSAFRERADTANRANFSSFACPWPDCAVRLQDVILLNSAPSDSMRGFSGRSSSEEEELERRGEPSARSALICAKLASAPFGKCYPYEVGNGRDCDWQ